MLIGICGKKRTGKDTLALILSKLLKEQGTFSGIIHFADHLKQVAAKLTGVEVHYFFNDDLKDVVLPEWGMTPRDILMKIDKGLIPQFGGALFVRPVAGAHDLFQKGFSNRATLIADVRFDRETQWLRANNAIMLHLQKDTGLESADYSEAGVPILFNEYVIDNNGTLEDLERQVQALLNQGVFQ